MLGQRFASVQNEKLPVGRLTRASPDVIERQLMQLATSYNRDDFSKQKLE
jgi:hypothetical protein